MTQTPGETEVPDTTFVLIGNSDNRLPQDQWSAYHGIVGQTIRHNAAAVYGEFVTESTSQWQSACWSFVLPEDRREEFEASLAQHTRRFGQESIAVVTGPVVMIEPAQPHDPADGIEPIKVPFPQDRAAVTPPVVVEDDGRSDDEPDHDPVPLRNGEVETVADDETVDLRGVGADDTRADADRVF